MEDKNVIIEKIQKLLRLSESPNEHEAALAAERARKLMEKYQVSTMETEGHSGEDFGVADVSFGEKGYFENWYSEFFSQLARLYDLKPYFKKLNAPGKRSTKLQVIGLQSDIELFTYAFRYLSEAIDRLYREAWNEWKKYLVEPMKEVHMFRRSFSFGCSHRILENMKEARETEPETTVEQSTELVIFKKDQIKSFLEQKGMNFKNGKKKQNKIHGEFYQQGREAGRGVNLNPALN